MFLKKFSTRKVMYEVLLSCLVFEKKTAFAIKVTVSRQVLVFISIRQFLTRFFIQNQVWSYKNLVETQMDAKIKSLRSGREYVNTTFQEFLEREGIDCSLYTYIDWIFCRILGESTCNSMSYTKSMSYLKGEIALEKWTN